MIKCIELGICDVGVIDEVGSLLLFRVCLVWGEWVWGNEVLFGSSLGMGMGLVIGMRWNEEVWGWNVDIMCLVYLLVKLLNGVYLILMIIIKGWIWVYIWFFDIVCFLLLFLYM